MRASLVLGLSLIVSIAAPLAPAAADDIVVSREDVDRAMKPLIDDKSAQSIVVAVVDSSGTRIFGYGHVSAKDDKAPDGKTVFEIGAATDVFTATLLANMELDGLVKADDPVQKYLPADVKLAEKDRPILLIDLITHMSGLPQLPSNVKVEGVPDPFANYTEKDLYSFLSSWKPERAPGEKMEYSDLAVGLLANALTHRAATSYEKLVTDRVTGPLGMTDTTITLNDSQQQRLAPGHNSDGKEVPNWHFTDALAGAGALKSTADDLVKLVKAELEPPAGKLGDAMRKTQEPIEQMVPGRMVGMAWVSDGDGIVIWHNGETAGYHSFVSFNPKLGSAVIVLTNTGTAAIDEAGSIIGRKQLGIPEPPPFPAREEVQLTEPQLDRFVGEYKLDPIGILKIRRSGDKLFAQVTDQPELRVFTDSDKSVFWKVVDAQLVFDFDSDTAPAKSCTLHQAGKELPAPRITSPATQPGK